MEINEILKTKLEQAIDAFNQSDTKLMEKNIAAIAENNKKLDKLSHDIDQLKIPEEINMQYFYEHKHINAGVKFMLIVLIAVIFTASGFCWYWMTKYNEYKGFSESYNRYTQQIQWDNDFFDYMNLKNPNDTKAFLKEKPIPEK